MPRFFFNYTSGGTTFADQVGTEFPSLEEAYLDTYESVLSIAFEKLRMRQDPSSDAFEITDHNHDVLIQIPFSEVLRPAVASRVSPTRRQTLMVLENCSREVARGTKLKDELCAELARTTEIFAAIRADLASFKLSHRPETCSSRRDDRAISAEPNYDIGSRAD